MRIIKRNGEVVDFDRNKIEVAMKKAFISVSKPIDENVIKKMGEQIIEKINNNFPESHIITVEEVQDLVEITLLENNFYTVVKSYILYRASHYTMRKTIEDFSKYFLDSVIIEQMENIQREFKEDAYNLSFLYNKFISFAKENLNEDEYLSILIRASSELTSKESPKWEFISARFLSIQVRKYIYEIMNRDEIYTFKDKIHYLTKKNLYGKYMLENYSDEDITELEEYMDVKRDDLFNYSGLDLIVKRYLIKNSEGEILETPQEMFMGIAMHLAIPEGDNKVLWAKKIYDVLSQLKITVATPTMSNARKPYHQLSSCFIDTVPDSLDGIYRSIDNFAQVSKHGGGMGLYFGKVRAMGSDIRGFKGVAGGVVRWIKLANDTAVAVDQLGVRQGAVAVYLDVWHKDIAEFLQLRTNNGDDRMKAHDVFPGVCFPDYFWELAKEDINANWYMMCPHEVETVKGYCLEDSYGKEWLDKYLDCVEDERIDKRVMKVKDMVRLVIKSAVETGTPFIFNRDKVNELNPNAHKGMIYSSNLCTEIAQNTSAIESGSTEIKIVDGEEVVVKTTKPGDFVVCNLASLVLGNIDVNNKKELEEVINTTIRALDNVIDLNYYPVAYAKITNKKYRSIGLGTSGYHEMLVKNNISWQSEEHLEFVDRVYEDINYFAIKASSEIAREKGSYEYFEGSDWQTGKYFKKRDYNSDRWESLEAEVEKDGLRNGYIMAIAPTGSTSIIAGTTAAVDPVMSRYFLEEKKGAIVPRVAPSLNSQTFWLYENAHDIDQNWIMRAAGVRQRHIDQSQSVNLYITTDYTMSQILGLYIKGYEEGVKTIYYVRNKSLEVEDCDSCSA
ncbi:ribonucleoside-diphosphate reductase alpha chain [Anaerosphaera aminiphila DSM 21120]|uniref:Ribonucleoside-diphosphate reductase n=1 Tax=Anaerosphaera aminiphila DSM 21120 TaxID=1120995 RepID=A0A1M5QR92_9FIRM|nr:ribonucleoside-diphosphate reductase subunit alpha [Anaerosphaera aminiphila]SHH16381.1 ribonucleoside-diphosphate reductase alpha chain [Anaerosphaera aminiphila DSM 21120]